MGKEHTSVHVHLDHAILDGGINLFLRGTGTTVENEKPGAIYLKKPLIGGGGVRTYKGLGDEPPNFSLTCF